MIKFIKKNKIALLYIGFICLLIGLHWNMQLNTSDDAIFSQILKEHTVFWQMKNVYLNGSGKIFSDIAAAIFTFLPPIIWKILNIAALLTIAVCINKIFMNVKDEDNSSIFLHVGGISAVLLLPLTLLTSSGYCATSTNYIWTSSSLMLSMLPLRYADTFKKKKYMYAVCLLATAYACNQEQSCAVLCVVLLLYIFYYFINKKHINRYIIVEFVTAIFWLLFMLASPARIKRMGYSRFTIPDYFMLSGFQKLVRGFSSTCAYLFNGKNLIWPLFCGMLLLLMLLYHKEFLKTLVAGGGIYCKFSFWCFSGLFITGKVEKFIFLLSRMGMGDVGLSKY